jgi:uncharacterized membrane protein
VRRLPNLWSGFGLTGSRIRVALVSILLVCLSAGPAGAIALEEPGADLECVSAGTGSESSAPEASADREADLFKGGNSPFDKFRRDPLANGLAVAILIGMLVSLAGVVLVARRPGEGRTVGFSIPVIAVAGLAVAGYLTFVETSGSSAVCGPVGSCNVVQQSRYAEVFGLVPVGVIGLIGYVGVVTAWLVARLGRARASDWAAVALLYGTVVGTLFSVYLTFLEPFVIGATCIWCLTSAVIITVLMWLSVGPAATAWARLQEG